MGGLVQPYPLVKSGKEYIKSLGDARQGNKAFSVRLALGALTIQDRLNLSDEETVRQITENPYLQYYFSDLLSVMENKQKENGEYVLDPVVDRRK
jgi:hypothetical protein